jgi:23S rRNA pseudouridine1911/1915/1917 synthase
MNKTGDRLFRAGPAHVNQTVAQALRGWLADFSWSGIRRLLASRRVTVSGNLCLEEGRRLKEAEVVKVLLHPAPAPPKEEDVRIRHADAHLVVAEKPAGMTTLRHPEERHWPRRRRQLQPTLDELLPGILERHESKRARRGAAAPGAPRKWKAAQRVRRLRAVHRLDRETSGIMVFARTVDAERRLGDQFRAHSLHRVYLAVVPGSIEKQTIVSYLVSDRGDGRRGSTAQTRLGKRAVTHVRPIRRLEGYTLVECRLETGRTHQIRIHLSESGHPVCGDKVYRGPYPGKPLLDQSGAPRLALHAAELGFDHPITGERLEFKMPLPPDLAAFVDRLARHSRGKAPG